MVKFIKRSNNAKGTANYEQVEYKSVAAAQEELQNWFHTDDTIIAYEEVKHANKTMSFSIKNRQGKIVIQLREVASNDRDQV